MVCLDSDILIDFLRNDKTAVARINELRKSNVELTTTSINTFELIKGALRSNREGAYENLAGFLNYLKVLDFDFSASKKTAEIFEVLRQKGEPIDILDLMIASVAIVNNESLLTRNQSHFRRISELKLL